MKAIVIVKPGGPESLELRERPIPEVGPTEVLIHIKAAAVNRPDIAQRKGHYPPPPGAPQDIPGLDVAGIVEDCGPAVRRWKPGDSVCALLSGGGYAEYAAVDEGQCLPIPKGWDIESASSLPETVFTVWQSVFQRGHLTAGEHFLVHGGSGGIGITAIQLAKAFGARVFATAGSAGKCDACLSLGASICVNYREEDFEEILRSEGVDLVLDMIGGEYFSKNTSLLRDEGRLVLINATKGNNPALDIRALMQKRLVITGSMLRNRSVAFKTALAREVEDKVWPILEKGLFKPVIYKKFPLMDASGAHALMERGEHIGKIILVNEES
jgi:NADPH2:quinone reductase